MSWVTWKTVIELKKTESNKDGQEAAKGVATTTDLQRENALME